MPEVQTDLRIHYRVVGEGPAVLWHTGGCGDGRMWELAGYVEGLPGFRHLLMDHRGRGLSDAPLDLEGHQMSRYVADVLAVLDDAQVEEAAFVGYSLGARVGYAVAQAAPDRLCGLVAIDSVPDRVTTPGELRADAREILTRGTADVIDEMAAYEEEPAPPWLVEHLRTTDTLAFAGGFEAEASEPDLWAAAPSLRVPVLLVIGLDDDEDRRAVGRDLAATLPDGELLELQAQHLAAFHRSDLTLPAISAFLDRLT